MPKQLINVVGIVIIVAILAAGILLVGMPMYLQALATGAQSAQVAQSNDAYQTSVDHLQSEKARSDEISADVAALQGQIPATPRSDDVFEIVAKAAAAADVTVVTVTAGDPTAWTPRTGAASDSATPAPAPAPTPAPTADGTADSQSTADAPAAAAPAAASPQVEVPFSISISTDDPAKAAAFLDQLGMGPRLIGIDSSTLTGSDGAYTLDVEALSFVRTES